MGTGRRLEVAGHLTITELFERYRCADDPTLKAHFQVMWLMKQGWAKVWPGGQVPSCV